MYVIVVGAGRIGSQAVDILTRSQNEVVVVEREPEAASRIALEHDCLVINDDATVKETLLEAGADRADAVVCTTDDDATNIMVLLLAEELEIPSLVTVVQNPEHMALFRRIGANVIENPQHLIAEYLVRAVQRPSIKDFMRLAEDAEVFEVTVVEGAPIADCDLEAAAGAGHIGEGVLVVAIERNGGVLTPKGDTEIRSGDLVTVFSRDGATGDVLAAFTGEPHDTGTFL
jgi:trk system potassium uptake protein TrkA